MNQDEEKLKQPGEQKWVADRGQEGRQHGPSALVTADPLPSLTPSTHPLALRGLPHRLFPLQRVATSPPLQLLLGRTFQKMPFLKARLVWAYPLASPARGQSPPHQPVVPDRPWGWGLLSGVLSDRVLSSQFPALCKLHPPLVVERAKELLEFVGSLGGPRSTGHMLTSVVRRPPPRPGLRLARGLLWAECCSLPRCGPLVSTSQCPGTGAAVRSRSAGSSKLWRPCSSRSPSLGLPPPFPSVLRRSSLCS